MLNAGQWVFIIVIPFFTLLFIHGAVANYITQREFNFD